MDETRTKALTIFAPAKINLYLHISGRLDNGYHTLDSLIAFADIGDRIEIEPAGEFEFQTAGDFAKDFSVQELESGPHSANLVVRATRLLAAAAHKNLNVRITLTKNLPLASGLGGGSADAAALIWGLMEMWNLPPQTHYLPEILTQLGADLPVCLRCSPARVRGIGEILDPSPAMKDTPIVRPSFLPTREYTARPLKFSSDSPARSGSLTPCPKA
jgi:4-diphosphocytidyl-2-C-methyl-D-erythritol kinase